MTATSIARLVLLVLLVPAYAEAGVVYGNLGANLGNQPFTVECGNPAAGGETVSGKTKATGAYSVRVRTKGQCKLKLKYAGQPLTAQIFSGDRPTEHSFVIGRRSDGSFELRPARLR